MFETFLKNFFVRSTDATQIKLLKLEILTNLANESNITFILREFQTYICSQDRDLVAATIQAIGRYFKIPNIVSKEYQNKILIFIFLL